MLTFPSAAGPFAWHVEQKNHQKLLPVPLLHLLPCLGVAFTVNIDNDLSNSNYAVVGCCDAQGSANGTSSTFSIHSSGSNNTTAPTTGAFRCCLVLQVNGVNQDVQRAAVTVFGG